MQALHERHCIVIEKGSEPLDGVKVRELLAQVQEWQVADDKKSISRLFRFTDFHQTMAFVNALAWVAHQQDHHPDLEVGYNRCKVSYSTHTVQGLSINDFICAARIDALLAR
ncbi:MAG TPA: 4a-hydroxytetrahydrobiopterin dehydratase [Gammaproteobacteria bacterium]